MARPTKLTPKVRERIKRGSKERERLEKSSRAKPRKAERKFLQFLNAVEKAQAGSDIRMVALISKAAETQWQAAAWRLERKNPDQWGRKQQLEHTGKDGGPVALAAEVRTYAMIPDNGRGDGDDKA